MCILNYYLQEEIYAKEPLNFVNLDHSNQAYGLHKVLYGLKQALRDEMRGLASSYSKLALKGVN